MGKSKASVNVSSRRVYAVGGGLFMELDILRLGRRGWRCPERGGRCSAAIANRYAFRYRPRDRALTRIIYGRVDKATIDMRGVRR